MEDDDSQIDEHITRLKKKKERLKIQKALILFKEAQFILGDKFSYELVLSVLSHSWKPSSDKQKEEWMKSAPSFRRAKRKTKRISSSQSNVAPRETSADENSRGEMSRDADFQSETSRITDSRNELSREETSQTATKNS